MNGHNSMLIWYFEIKGGETSINSDVLVEKVKISKIWMRVFDGGKESRNPYNWENFSLNDQSVKFNQFAETLRIPVD